MKSYHVVSFTEDEILDSIKQENLIEKGGSGNVYRVRLKDGKELAVKHIWNSGGEPKKSRPNTPMLSRRGSKCREFDSEVETLSSIRHVNVVKLYCSITSQDSSLLVYESMPKGSLWDQLHSVGAAKGLEYFHHGYERPVIHRDVKSSNILLDEFLKPRIADFGFAKIIQANEGNDSTNCIPVTHGYIAPEYGYTSKVNEKIDVYGFGVVLMELVSGRRPLEPEFGDSKDIVSWVSNKLKDRESVLSVIDSAIQITLQDEAIKLTKDRDPLHNKAFRSQADHENSGSDARGCRRLVGIVVSKDGSDKIQECLMEY
ncbi:Receptor-like protein [Drosera capensis]